MLVIVGISFWRINQRLFPVLTLSQVSHWSAPPPGFIKINVDAAVVKGLPRVGIEVVARDEFGFVIQTRYSGVEGDFSAHVVEVLAVREGLLLASKQSWKHIIVESDAVKAVN